jgi:hypothetical protein
VILVRSDPLLRRLPEVHEVIECLVKYADWPRVRVTQPVQIYVAKRFKLAVSRSLMADGDDFDSVRRKLTFSYAPTEPRDDLLRVCFANVARPVTALSDGFTNEIGNVSMSGWVKMQLGLFHNNNRAHDPVHTSR